MDHPQSPYEVHQGNGRTIQVHRPSMPELRSPGSNGFPSSNGPVPVPSHPPGINGNGQITVGHGAQGSNGMMSKSPPSAPSQKNTKHVPCKFFYKGQCAAGDTCPYSHNPEPPEPCKFFLNGNCKYGNNCALPHYNSAGQLLNPQCFSAYRKPRRQGPPPGRPLQLGMNGQHPQSGMMYPYGNMDRSLGQTHIQDFGDYGSPPGSNLGSPGFEAQYGRSPPFRSALDAPLPASFNSQDMPNIQKFGQHAMSVPAKGGLGPLTQNSPTTSIASHEAFGNLDSALHEKLNLGSSPPETRAEVAPRRIIPNGRSIFSADLPSSMPMHDRGDLLRGFGHRPQPAPEDHEEDYLPDVLSDLMTPQEKMRRFSRTQEDASTNGRPSHSAFVGSPNSKVGSPSGASPSRFSGFFAERAKREAEAAGAQMGSSPFGHVGSPLRNSTLSANARRQHDFGGQSPSFGPISPPRSKEVPMGLSSLSEQLRMVRKPAMNENSTQQPPQSLPRPIGERNPSLRRDRVLSAGSANPSERTDDEDACFFSMEDDDEMKRRKEASGAI